MVIRSFIALLILLGGSLCHSETGASDPKVSLYAVIVGIKQFKDPNIPALTISDKDARDFHTFLKDTEKLFKKTSLILLLNEQATRANVAKALRQSLKPAGKDDIVIIFLSGHGAADPALPNEFYFITHDTQWNNLFGTALLMNDTNLFKGVDSDRILMLSDACHSGGFNEGIQRSIAKEAGRFFSLFDSFQGRTAISSSRPDEKSFEDPKFGNSIFTHYLLRGLRGEAAKPESKGNIASKDLYGFVYDNTRKATEGKQNPQFYSAKGKSDDTTVFMVRTYSEPLNVKVQFFSEDDSGRTQQLHDQASVKSGAKIGLAFQPDSDCYVYVFWWDTNGSVGRLFPNPSLTEGTGQVKANKTYWLPSGTDGERWYVLDNNPGYENIYFVASREKNPKLESLYNRIEKLSREPQSPNKTKIAAGELEREINLMGISNYTIAKTSNSGASSSNREQLFNELQNQIQISGADKVVQLRLKHE